MYKSIALNQSNLELHLFFYFLMHLMENLGHIWQVKMDQYWISHKVTWSPLLRAVVISMLKEIMAVKFALFSFCPNASNSVIGVCCNNSSVVTYSNLVGGLGSEALECYH